MQLKVRSAAISVVLFYALALPLILSNYDKGRAYGDQKENYLPTIVHFVKSFDTHDYRCAMTPGYFIIMAGAVRVGLSGEVALKLISSLFTAALVGLLAWKLVPRVGKHYIALLAPALLSLYFLPSGVWLLPDNMAWLTVLCVLLVALSPPIKSRRRHWLGGVALAVGVLVRQSNIWLTLPLWVSSTFRGQKSSDSQDSRAHSLALSLLSTIPSFAMIGYFYHQWGGFVPPSCVTALYSNVNLAAPAFFLSLLCIFSPFFLPYALGPFRKLMQDKRAILLAGIGLLLGLLAATIPATDWSFDAGRSSGVWEIVKMAPAIYHRSVLIAILSSLGGALGVTWVLMVKKEVRWIIAASMIGFIASQTANHFAYQRYYDGFLFLIIYLSLLTIADTEWKHPPRWAALGPLSLAVLNGLILIKELV